MTIGRPQAEETWVIRATAAMAWEPVKSWIQALAALVPPALQNEVLFFLSERTLCVDEADPVVAAREGESFFDAGACWRFRQCLGSGDWPQYAGQTVQVRC